MSSVIVEGPARCILVVEIVVKMGGSFGRDVWRFFRVVQVTISKSVKNGVGQSGARS